MIRAVLAAVFLVAAATPAFARAVDVPADHTTIVRLPSAASALVVGNPDIADATLYDSSTVFLTGKAYGRTNLVALNEAGEVIYTSDLVVTQSGRGMVQVFRNTERESYACAPECEAAPRVGDSGEYFGQVSGQQDASAPSGGQ
ncbi:pilus assembly protein [Marinicauda salina]|uniref:Pilus assembly protein n=1 Tax=Marinicauda salina TaxID=2135793 RepID=A0A2U2BXM8_9PROT|nr:pilus assembly protein N-terminal domain-containing protein [Marinicauda salina]PWE18762.1 pilus assembly protein [Marinicauda salina]